MCGIFGSIDFIGKYGYLAPPEEFRKVLSHRGPDDYGVVILDDGPQVVLTQNRLSIIDLSPSGKQPMSNEDEKVWITFNGEIYGFEGLREDLIRKGHIFKSSTDTEVILHLYEEEGPRCLDKLNGMFAFAIWDQRKRRLFLARDRLGVKPLVYTVKDGICIFGSELKALFHHPAFSRQVDREGLELYFTFNFIPSPWTIFRDVKKLPPAHFLLFSDSGAELVKYWSIKADAPAISDFDLAQEELRNTVSDATRIRLRSDVPLGAFLSGGIDSSIVVANMARLSSQTVQTYFLGYSEDELFDETPYARAVADMYGTDHYEIRLSQKDVLGIIPDVISSFDEPFADSSALPTYVVSREIRKHVSVALSGDGGDEIFGGYRRYLAGANIELFLKIPKFVRTLLASLVHSLPDSKGNKYLEIVRRLKIFLNGVEKNSADRHYSWMTLFPDQDRQNLLSRGMLSMFKGGLGRSHISMLAEDGFADNINNVLLTDFKFLLPGDMLNKVDWMSMRNALEVRSPLLDYRVAELAFRLPGNFKVQSTKLKLILKSAFRDHLPQALWARKKQGFEIPIGEWFKRETSLREMFWDLAEGNRDFFDITAVKRLFDDHMHNRRDASHKLWAILVFCYWKESQCGAISL